MLTLLDVQRLAEELHLSVKLNGKGFECFCPAHGDDKTRHLYIAPGDRQPIIAHCKKGCGFKEIAAAFGVDQKEFCGRPPTRQSGDSITHDYPDEMGRVRYQTCRQGRGQGKRIWQRRPDPARPGEWINSIKGIRKFLYRLPEILDADPEAIILMGAGESVADVLAESGSVGTTNPMGEANWRDPYADVLIGRRVAVFPDADETGDLWTKSVCASLEKRAIPHAVVRLPEIEWREKHGLDAYDWVHAMGHRPHELLDLAEAAFIDSGQTLEWEPPLPLSWGELPSFPVDALPGPLARIAAAAALSLQTPADVPGMFILALLALACQKRFVVQVREDWLEPLSLWVLIVQDPGNRKSQLVKMLKRPAVDYETGLVARMGPEIAESQMEHRIKTGRLKKLEDEAIKAKDEFKRGEAMREAKRLAGEVESFRVPGRPRLMVDDCTPEKLSILLSENYGRMAVIAAEGGVFDILAGKYASGTANLDLYLAGHSGDDVISDRVGRASVVIRDCALTLGLTVQPSVLQGFAAKPTFKGRGLLGRFLYTIPLSLLGRREVDPPAVPETLMCEYAAVLSACLEMEALTDEEDQPLPHTLILDAEANAEVNGTIAWMEPRLGILGELNHMTDWAGKAVGQMVRIAALLHIAELAETKEPWKFPVGADSVKAARCILEYLIPHAVAAYQMMQADETTRGAHHILEWLKSKGPKWFTRRALHRHLAGTFPKVAELEAPLLLLAEHGYIRRRPDERPGEVGRKSVAYDLHPNMVRSDEGLGE